MKQNSNKLVNMLFSKEVDGLHDDDFEGSIDDYRIFTEVFFGNENGRTSKRCLVTGGINFECDYSKQTDISLCSNSETSGITSQEDSCNGKGGSRGNSGSGCFSKGFELLKRDVHDGNAKRMKLSVDELSNAKPNLGKAMNSSAPFKRTGSGMSEPASHSVCHTVTCHLVESSSQGVTSSCYMLKRQAEMDRGGNMDDRDVSKCELSILDGSEGKEIVVSKAIASPVSQESFANKLLVASPLVTVANKSGSDRCVNKRWMKSQFLEVDLAKMSPKRDSMKDPRPLLRYHTKLLLIAAGWDIGRRKREDTACGEYVYRSPEGRPIREFRRAWDLCGRSLFADGNDVVQETDGKQWTNITQFLSDLSNTLVEIEEQLNNSETTTALAHRWCLLDPFANVVFIDKKLGALKAGNVVKANKSFVVDAYAKNDAVLALKYVDSIGNQFTERHVTDRLCGSSLIAESALTVFEGNNSIREEECGKGTSADFGQFQRGAEEALKGVLTYLSEEKYVHSVDSDSGTSTLYREISGNQKSSLDLSSLPACGSDNTSDQCDSSLYEVPVISGNVNVIFGGSETVSPHQDSNTSSPSCHRHSSDHDEEIPLEVIKDVIMGYSGEEDKTFKSKVDKVGNQQQGSLDDHPNCTNGLTLLFDMNDGEMEGRHCIDVPTFKMDDLSATDVMLKKRMCRKSKKISEIKPTTLHKNDRLGRSTFKAELHDIDKNSIQLQSRGVYEYIISNVGSTGSCRKSSPYLSQHQSEKKQLKKKKFHRNSGTCRKMVQVTCGSGNPMELNFENNTDEASLHVNNESLGYQTWRQFNKLKQSGTQDERGQKRLTTCQLKDDDLLISAIIKNKSFKSTTEQSTSKMNSGKSKALRKRKSQKGSCRLLPRSVGKGGKHFMNGKWYNFGVRTVLSWLIDSGVVSLNEVIQYRDPKDDAVVKDGLVTRDGILCKCCGKVLSISVFKIHAGFRLNRPCLNLFMESGKPFTLCQLEAWSAEYKARKSATRTVQVDEMDQNDDSCGLCGDGGELICCDNCPSTFHQACLHAQELPEGNWYCPNCTCRICGHVVANEPSKSSGALKCSLCEHKYHEACLKEQFINGGVTSDTWFCGESCQEVYSGLQSRIGLTHFISDGFSWTLLKCIHGDQRVHSAQRFVALKAECNLKLAVALTIMEECFLSMVDPRTGIDMIPHVLYNWGSAFARLNYHGFYTVVLEKDDVLMSVASIRIHGVTVAEMPLIATCSKYRRQGMCRRLLNSIEEMLKSFKVEKLVISAIPDVVETWTAGFGFKPLEDDERQSLSNINLMVFPGTIWLKKPLYENQAIDQQTGSNHVSQVGTDDPTGTGPCSKGGPDVGTVQRFDGNFGVKEVDAETETRVGNSRNSPVGEDQEGTLGKHFSKLSCEEPASVLGGNRGEVVCHVESLDVDDGGRTFLGRTVA
ncbi:hypothetical protein F0562_010585 [Nyssa sinensis]|uniref:PHD-type domain-containing protein n=1 Tax=Nyssa sinensis TaxID=561372 RepID=A0A5J5A1C4_9ASTE|nr:hypothetical protein F0562_010585 [Nyssa sinensis]